MVVHFFRMVPDKTLGPRSRNSLHPRDTGVGPSASILESLLRRWFSVSVGDPWLIIQVFMPTPFCHSKIGKNPHREDRVLPTKRLNAMLMAAANKTARQNIALMHCCLQQQWEECKGKTAVPLANDVAPHCCQQPTSRQPTQELSMKLLQCGSTFHKMQ